MSSPTSNVFTKKQLFKKIERPQKLGEVKAKNMTKNGLFDIVQKGFQKKRADRFWAKSVFALTMYDSL